MTAAGYEEFYTEQEYDKEVDKIIVVDDPFFMGHLYHAISKSIFVKEELTVSEKGYEKICNYLLDNFERLTDKLKASIRVSDLETGICTLKEKIAFEDYEPGVHYIDESIYYLEELEKNMLTDFKIESWEDNASAN